MKLKFRILPIPCEDNNIQRAGMANIPLVFESDKPYLWFLWEALRLKDYLLDPKMTKYELRKL